MCLVLWVSFYKEILLGYHNGWQWPGIPAILTYSLFWLIHLFSQKAEHWNFRNPNLSHKSFIREGKDIETPFILSATKFLYFFFLLLLFLFCFVLFFCYTDFSKPSFHRSISMLFDLHLSENHRKWQTESKELISEKTESSLYIGV